MKRVALIGNSTALPGEKGYTRFCYLANFLATHGFDVEMITSTFQHWEKKQRDISKVSDIESTYKITCIYEPGYKKNVDIRRINSHKVFSKNLAEYLKTQNYDLIYCVIPPNNMGKEAALYAKAKNIPFVIDVEDLWPEAMKMVLDIPVISSLAFAGVAKDAREIYLSADAVVGSSDEYRDRPLKDNPDIKEHITVYVGNEIDKFDEGIHKYEDMIEKAQDDFWVTYAGNLGTSYDIKTLILASAQLKRRGYSNIRIMILGGGPLEEEFKQTARDCDCNVSFEGYIEYPKMAAYLSKSDILVNSFVKKAPQSIVTKIGDYLAAGKPMINTCMSPEFRGKVDNDGFGINVEPEDPAVLADAIEYLYKNPNLCIDMGAKARNIAKTQFDRKESNKRIVELLERLLEKDV
ncbi:glycosyltransferase family 4 protein [Christensenella intestinihominis]|uniref:glycosyltransferase family 4 protein n=1 Tax=Christensenella intestinihominis TaxID=1851429 RepID=UPI000836862A|nr:glycosyltransferase family 4 protein [Christensenella intestinihominis]